MYKQSFTLRRGMAAPEEVCTARDSPRHRIFVCALFLFIAYSYFSFVSPRTRILASRRPPSPMSGFREYLVLLAIFLISSIICSATDRLPFIGILVSAVPVYYVVRLYHNKMLVYMPMIIMLLSLFFFSGEIIATVQWVAKKLKK